MTDERSPRSEVGILRDPESFAAHIQEMRDKAMWLRADADRIDQYADDLLAANDLQHANVGDASCGGDGTETVALSVGADDGVSELLHDGSASLGDALHADEGVHLEGSELGAEVSQRSLTLGDELLVGHGGVGETGLPDLNLGLEDFGGALGDELISGHSGNLHYHDEDVKREAHTPLIDGNLSVGPWVVYDSDERP